MLGNTIVIDVHQILVKTLVIFISTFLLLVFSIPFFSIKFPIKKSTKFPLKIQEYFEQNSDNYTSAEKILNNVIMDEQKSLQKLVRL